MSSRAAGRSSLRFSRNAAPRVFIAYRWDDTLDVVFNVRDGLATQLRGAYLFVDEGIHVGERVQERIAQEIERCDTMVVLVGRRWLDVSDADGRRRLDSPDDPVRIEIAAALRARLRVVPVLVDGAQLPRGKQLPEEIRDLDRFKATVLRRGRDWPRDLDALAEELRRPLRPSAVPLPPRRRRARGRTATALAIPAGGAALFGVALALSSSLSSGAMHVARPTASLKLVKAPTVALTVPTFTGTPAALRATPAASSASSSASSSTGASTGTHGSTGTTGGGSTSPADGLLHGSS